MMGTRLMAAAVPALLLLGVACARPQTASRADIDGAVARGDTVALGRLAARQCQPLSGDARTTCYENFFVELAGSDRIHVALGALASLASEHADIEANGHGYTHIIGIRAWHPGADVAAIFRQCNGLFQSGCYHGVIQAYLTQGGQVDSAHAVALCDEVAPGASDRWLRFQCVHGLGHGFEMSWNWDLPRALKGCDWLHNTWDRYSCYGGVFMENAVASMPGGHDMAMHALAASDSAKGGMPGMPDMDMSKVTFKMRDPKDALYPCSVVDSQYQFSCYQLQGGVILTRTEGDFGQATKECDKAPPMLRTQCYLSLGTNASGMTMRNRKESIADCSHGDPGFQPFCFEGVVKNFIDVSQQPEDGFAFCKLLPEGPNRLQCFISVGEEISVLDANLDARARECTKAGSGDEAACRRGAQLPEGKSG